MNDPRPFSSFSIALSAILLFAATSGVAPAQTVTNVRASQLADKTVEVLYDLTGAASGGATVSVAFSSDGGTTYTIVPAGGALSGNVGVAVASGTNRRIVWAAASTLPAQTYGTNYKAAVTATNPGSGGQEVTVTLAGGVALTMVRIPAGTFQRGSPASERNRSSDETLHQVTLTSDYYMGKYLVTQGQWQAVMGTAMSTTCGSYGIGASYPVYCVSWNDIRGTGGFIEKLNTYLTSTGQAGPGSSGWRRRRSGRGRRARGTQTRFSFGDALFGVALDCDDDDACGACSSADPYVWWCRNSGYTIHPVGTKQANPYGLFDMHGNLFEWCEDWYGAYSSTAQTNPTGPTTGSTTGSIRVGRSGGWGSDLRGARSAGRNGVDPDGRYSDLGFRLSRSL